MAYGIGDYLVRCIMTAQSGLPEDAIVNDWAFRSNLPLTPSEAATLGLQGPGDFYRLGATLGDRVGSYIGSQVNRAATHTIAVYKIGDLGLGSPIVETAWLGPTLPNSAVNLPTEVAGVLSFHGSLTDVPEEAGLIRPKARRRGRVFIGPLNEIAITGDVDPAPKLTTQFTAAMRSNATAMADRVEALAIGGGAGTVRWCVWSRADETLYPVVGGWTDDAPDTQRRRGQEAQSRVVYTV